jgi:WD40 repeat protein
VVPGDSSQELRHEFAAALDGPNSRALLIVDQFEEVFSSQVEEGTRERFLDNLVDLADDPRHRIRVVLTLRADFSDRPLAHPRFGQLMSSASMLLAPMRPEQLEDVIRRPAARVGVQVEPGLIAEIVRDVAAAPASLPLLQYVLSELFERRAEDRLTVHAYRALGGVQGVLERRAETTFAALGADAQHACRQLFLRMVHVGDEGEETRRRLPLTELRGLGRRAQVDEALEAFTAARLLTYDREPITRTPTVEVAHETVIRRWARYRIWVDETRVDLLAHRRLSAAAATWAAADEDPSYLLTGGPLAAALEVASGDRISLNDLEARFVSESRRADEAAARLEMDRRREEAVLQQRARRRLQVGIAATAVAGLIAVVAAFAWVERQRADDLAAAQQRQNLARELAAASIVNLTSADPELSLLLALEAADHDLDAGEEILPEVVEALHRAVINPRPDLFIDGAGSAIGGRVLDYTVDGASLVMLADDGGAAIVDPATGDRQGRIRPMAPPAFGVAAHPDGRRVLTIHPDAVRVWDWRSEALELELAGHPEGVTVTTAAYSRDGSAIAVGRDDGVVRVWRADVAEDVDLHGHTGRVDSVDFDPSGARLVSGGSDSSGQGPPSYGVLVWDIASGSVTTRARLDTLVLPVTHLAWHPFADVVAVTTQQAENVLLDARTGERLNSFGNGQHRSNAVAFDRTGHLVIAASVDGFARVYGTWTGGEATLVLPTGGVPLRDAAFDPSDLLTVATVGVDGRVRIWRRRDLRGSELPARDSMTLYPQLAATPDGSRYVLSSHDAWFFAEGVAPTMEVIDAATGGSLISRPTASGWGFRQPAIAADGALAAYAGASGDAEIVHVDAGVTMPVPGSGDWTVSLAFSPDAALLAGGGVDGSIAIWDTATGDVVRMLRGHGDRRPRILSVPAEPWDGRDDALAAHAVTIFRVDQVVFRPDGSELASARVRRHRPRLGPGDRPWPGPARLRP